MKTITITDNGTEKTSKLLAMCRKEFEVYSYLSNDQLDTQFPPPKLSTSRTFNDTQEPDEDLQNMSYDDVKKKNIEFMTIRERIIFELEYYKRTGEHPDEKNITLTSSLDEDGGVLRSCWIDYRFCVLAYDQHSAYPFIRARRVVLPVSLESVPFDPSELKIEYKGKVYKIVES